MSARGTQQGSSSYTIVIGVVGFALVGGILLTLFFYPVADAFIEAPIWSAETDDGALIATYVEGMWVFAGGFMLVALTAFVWVRTRQ